jgi:hypothetical protein
MRAPQRIGSAVALAGRRRYSETLRNFARFAYGIIVSWMHKSSQAQEADSTNGAV